MSPHDDLYTRLGVKPGATTEAIQQAYRVVARRFHPDSNSQPGAQEEFKKIGLAYETLRDPARRAAYDSERAGDQGARAFALRCVTSRGVLPVLDEPQVVYALVAARPQEIGAPSDASPSINLCLVIDRSTSMKGDRLDQVQSAVQAILEHMRPRDSVSVITFSDRAEVVVPVQSGGNMTIAKAKVSTIRAEGGTELLQGLKLGLEQVRQRLDREAVNQVILLTDGRTYGDDHDCLELASQAAEDGIRIRCLGLGEEWNDVFLDELASRTGAHASYLDSPEAIWAFLEEQLRAFASVYAERLTLQVSLDEGIELMTAFKLYPEPRPLPRLGKIRLGSLYRDYPAGVLLQFLVPPRKDGEVAYLGRLTWMGDVVAAKRMDEQAIVDLELPVRKDATVAAPPPEISDALGKLVLYGLQEKARAEVERGQIAEASRRLTSLATRLLSAGEATLARAVLDEAETLTQTRHLSEAGTKRLKYGTRALLAPPKDRP